jgi:PAS domain S-box-containing protein
MVVERWVPTAWFRKSALRSSLLAVAIGVMVSLLAFGVFRHILQQNMQSIFARRMAQSLSILNDDLASARLTMDAARAYYAGSARVEVDEFQAFAEPFLRDGRGMLSLWWVRRQSAAQRATNRTQFPVSYVEPRRGFEAAAGYDLAAEPGIRQALGRACDTAALTCTELPPPVRQQVDPRAVLLVQPIYENGRATETTLQRRTHLAGFVVGVFDLRRLLERAAPTQSGVRLEIQDAGQPRARRDYCEQIGIELGGLTWQLDGTPTALFFQRHVRWTDWTVLISGLLCTALLAWYTFRMATRNARVQRLVKQQTRQLRAGKDRLRRIASALGEGVLVMDREGRATFVNPAAAQLFGWSETELAGRQLHDMIHCRPDGSQLPADQCPSLQVLLSGRSVRSDDQYFRRKDGSVFPVSLVANPLLEDDRVTGSVTVFSDITERKLAADTARRDESRLEALLALNRMTAVPLADVTSAALEAMVKLTDSAIGYLAFLNDDESVLTMHAWSRSAMSQCQVVDKPMMYPVATTGLWGEAVRQRRPVTTNDYAAPNPLKHGYPPGHVNIVRHMNVPVFDGDHIVAVAGVGNKATDYDSSDVRQLDLFLQGVWRYIVRRQATEDLRRARDELEQRVAERTAELADANQALRAQAKDLDEARLAAEAASRVKSEFLANISHEIRTPMTAILGFSELMSAPHLPPDDRQQFLDGIRNNGKALLALINDILDLSRIEADALTMKKTPCLLQLLLDDVTSTARFTAREKGLAFDLEYDFPLPRQILTDPVRLRQILMNLLGNAVKFTDQGGIRMIVRCPPADNGRARVQFVISDTGIGIPADRIGDLFQPFMQVDGSATRRHGGTGLGLAISQRLAQALGGQIEVSSTFGRGSAFAVTVDAGESAELRMVWELDPAEAPMDDWPRLRQSLSGRVLLTEDVPDVQRVAGHILRALGLQADVAENGRVACEMAARSRAAGTPYDVILMDIQMPEMNGYEATTRLRQEGWTRPIVALTAHAMLGDREKCLEVGCDDYLAKPIVPGRLAAVLARWLNQSLPDERAMPAPEEPASAPRCLLEGGVLNSAEVTRLPAEFADELPERAESLDDALRQRDHDTLASRALQLQSTAEIYGFVEIADGARGVHDLAHHHGDWGELDRQVAALVELCAQAATAEVAVGT